MGFALSDMQLMSSAFAHGENIPAKHTGEGQDTSPALAWRNEPDGVNAFAVICHDPDAPLLSPAGTYGFVHWVLYNIPGTVSEIAEGSQAFTNGLNDFGNESYGGPMPPNGHGEHQYYFWLLALNEAIDLKAGLTMWQLLKHIEPHVIGMNRLVGTYQRN